jgi:hypothetical protein
MKTSISLETYFVYKHRFSENQQSTHVAVIRLTITFLMFPVQSFSFYGMCHWSVKSICNIYMLNFFHVLGMSVYKIVVITNFCYETHNLICLQIPNILTYNFSCNRSACPFTYCSTCFAYKNYHTKTFPYFTSDHSLCVKIYVRCIEIG